jgi:GT2 family glycosyltransferase
LEVIVVDNASRDGTPEYLRLAATQHENLRVILNDENRGFAAANNQGLEVARGDFLVLLNNDTAVPRGWLSSLVRHLSSDDSIGLIGPVTNQIGNEARIPVRVFESCRHAGVGR